jgi:hypothetical protein
MRKALLFQPTTHAQAKRVREDVNGRRAVSGHNGHFLKID